MQTRLFLIAAALVMVLAVAGAGIVYFMTFSPDRNRFPVRGIDVSRHQGSIDWERVAADDVAFAIIKATEGGDWVDSRFAENLASARAAGLTVGAYHFFTFCRPGAEQAQNFLSAVPRDEPLLPPVVDIEFIGNCDRRPPGPDFAEELNAFLEPVEAAFGTEVIVYLTGEAVNVYSARVPNRRRWVRSLAWRPSHDDWVYWQYHDRGRVDGIEGSVDLNVLQGGLERLAELNWAAP